jgi:KipI family sensor histidine kinase inhibitor
VYDGPDLKAVAALTGLSVAEVVAAHTATPWRVGFGGFAPGFAYLVGGDPRLEVPRRPEPRPSVPAGAVGLAGRYSGVYPRSSPGGWQLIGHTDAVLFDRTVRRVRSSVPCCSRACDWTYGSNTSVMLAGGGSRLGLPDG